MHPWHDISWGRDVCQYFMSVIEIPEGSKIKYELDKATGLLIADRVLYSAVHYPANYGFIPQTYCDDGDPLDVLLLCQQSMVPLSMARSRAIGTLSMTDEKGVDDKIIAVHLDDPQFEHYRDISELSSHTLSELRRFFIDYKVLENKEVAVESMHGHQQAEAVIRSAIRSYAEQAERLRQDTG